MALVRQPTQVTISFKDRGRAAHTSFYMGESAGNPPNPLELANPNAVAPFSFLQELYQSMQNASDCLGVGYSVTYSWSEEPALLAFAGGNPQVERKGVLSFDSGATRSIFTIPGIKFEAEAANGRKLAYNLDAGGNPVFTGPTATHLQSIHDKLRNGATINLLNYPVVDKDGNDYSAMRDGYIQNRSSSGRG